MLQSYNLLFGNLRSFASWLDVFQLSGILLIFFTKPFYKSFVYITGIGLIFSIFGKCLLYTRFFTVVLRSVTTLVKGAKYFYYETHLQAGWYWRCCPFRYLAPCSKSCWHAHAQQTIRKERSMPRYYSNIMLQALLCYLLTVELVGNPIHKYGKKISKMWWCLSFYKVLTPQNNNMKIYRAINIRY